MKIVHQSKFFVTKTVHSLSSEMIKDFIKRLARDAIEGKTFTISAHGMFDVKSSTVNSLTFAWGTGEKKFDLGRGVSKKILKRIYTEWFLSRIKGIDVSDSDRIHKETVMWEILRSHSILVKRKGETSHVYISGAKKEKILHELIEPEQVRELIEDSAWELNAPLKFAPPPWGTQTKIVPSKTLETPKKKRGRPKVETGKTKDIDTIKRAPLKFAPPPWETQTRQVKTNERSPAVATQDTNETPKKKRSQPKKSETKDIDTIKRTPLKFAPPPWETQPKKRKIGVIPFEAFNETPKRKRGRPKKAETRKVKPNEKRKRSRPVKLEPTPEPSALESISESEHSEFDYPTPETSPIQSTFPEIIPEEITFQFYVEDQIMENQHVSL